MEKKAYLFVLNTMADWEPGFLTAELNTGRFFKKDAPRYTLKTIGLNRESVVTMGGLTIVPDIALDQLDTHNVDLLILPGSDIWLEPGYNAVMEKVKQLLDAGVTVAAICGATMALAQAGILNNTPHTSNALEALKAFCPDYRGEDHYKNEPVVISGNLITASGIAPLEFAHKVLGHLDVFAPETLDAWFNLYKTKEGKYYFALMEAVTG